MSKKDYDEVMKMKQEKSCFNCKFYETSDYVCMYNCDCRCILSEEESAKKCKHFAFGKYDVEALENSNYR